MPANIGNENNRITATSLRVKRCVAIILLAAVFGISLFALSRRTASSARPNHWKLYWFVPDGFRADPNLFDIFKWAREGKLPNIKRMMEQGSYGYSIPVFPSHTPVNFATLFTGCMPARHGVADGPLRLRGYPLKIVPRTGFSSLTKTIDPMWYTLEQAGLIVSLLSIPGSTPPELTTGSVVKGRWGGWGVEFPNTIFHSQSDRDLHDKIGWNDRVFQIEKTLTDFVGARDPSGWQMALPKSYSPPREVNLSKWGRDLFALIVDTADDGVVRYDRAYFSSDKRTADFDLGVGGWSEWFPVRLAYQVHRSYQDQMPQRLKVEQRASELSFDTQARVRVIRLGGRDEFRFRVLYDGLNESVARPSTLSEELHRAAGPMVDFVDNYPPQLIYYPEDKEAFLDESEMSFAWHKRAQKFFLQSAAQDIFIQSIYSPNQMLTSRWWMGFLDPRGREYGDIGPSQREEKWNEVLRLYRHVDEMIGAALDARPRDAYVVLSSDHGAVPLNYEVRLNNFFASKGWLKTLRDPETGRLRVDWRRTKVVFLNMNHVFVRPDGLDGPYQPASGSEYEKLRAEVFAAIRALRSPQGVAPLEDGITREEAGKWGLPMDKIGDLVIANASGYSWTEDTSPDGVVFATSLKGGYKQAVLPMGEPGLWTPFLIVGPGIKKGHEIRHPISHLQQYPTVMRLLKVSPPYRPEADALAEIFETGAL